VSLEIYRRETEQRNSRPKPVRHCAWWLTKQRDLVLDAAHGIDSLHGVHAIVELRGHVSELHEAADHAAQRLLRLVQREQAGETAHWAAIFVPRELGRRAAHGLSRERGVAAAQDLQRLRDLHKLWGLQTLFH
jgi:hypothetical protein